MIRYPKKLICSFLLAVSAVLASGCGTQASETAESGVQAPSSSAAVPETQLPEKVLEEETDLTPGAKVAGFTVDSVGENDFLSSELITFSHEQSGAKLAYIRNSDPELAFGIFYNTPSVDEADTNHVFEHAIIASSEKYPSKDLFFDMANKTYSTFINAFTYDTFTGYPFSSESEDQFIKMIDAYLSCMTAPEILTNENIFKREALRYELYSLEDPIAMTGTVYAEDFGFLTDTSSEAFNNVADALYPGETAANSIGRAHRSYQALTYEHTLETYNRCYHFDNSLILLYGDMDYERVLSFIDQEYLSKAERNGTDLSAYQDPATEDGHVQAVIPSPAFEGDLSEHVSQIDYAVSLADMDWDSLLSWDLLSTALSQENGKFAKLLRERGIQNQYLAGLNVFCAKPYLSFTLYQADESQAQDFFQAIQDCLKDVAENGIEEDLFHSVLKQAETATYLTRNSANVGVNLFPAIANYWTHTGEVDFYGRFEQVLAALEEDDEQEIFRSLASDALNAGRTALVTTVPTPGLAEEIMAEQDAYLAQMKAGMSQEELEKLIRETEEFNAWNESEASNNDFIIDPSLIPDQEVFGDYTRTDENGITFYESPADIEKAGQYALYFDASRISQEDLPYLALYECLLGRLGTSQHSSEEIAALTAEYMSSWTVKNLYPEPEAGDRSHPMLVLSWIGLTEDFESSLNLWTEILGATDFSDTGLILETISRYKTAYDLSRPSDPLNLATDLAKAYFSRSVAYQMAVNGQDFYRFLEETERRLAEDEAYGQELAGRLNAVAEKMLTRTRLIAVSIAPEEDLEAIRQTASQVLSSLAAPAPQPSSLQLPEQSQTLAVSIEGSSQYTVLAGSTQQEETFQGRYAPFLTALSDRYFTPLIRFQNGAYSSGIASNHYSGLMCFYSYSDPNASETVKIFQAAGDALREIEIAEEDLNGYILQTLASATTSRGVLAQPLMLIESQILGNDLEQSAAIINDIKNASLEDQEAAADCISRIIDASGIVTIGNEAALAQDADFYDQVISYRKP